MAATNGQKQTYKQAMDELQEILQKLRKSADQVDVDDLLADVQRAKVLIAFCDGKIKNADMQIQDVLRQINPQAEQSSPPPDPDEYDPSEFSDPPPPFAEEPARERDIPF